MVYSTGCISMNCIFLFSINNHILHSFYIFYTVTINMDYLFDYLSIICTVNHNSNVGMGNNSQCIHFTISTRIHSLVIHRFTVETKRWTAVIYYMYIYIIFSLPSLKCTVTPPNIYYKLLPASYNVDSTFYERIQAN